MTNSVISRIKQDPALKESTQALVKNALSDADRLMQRHRESWNDWAREGPQQVKEALLGAAGNKDKIFQDIIAQLEEGYVLKFRDEVEKRNREK